MTFQEKSAWIMGAVLAVVYGWYFVSIAGEISGDVAEISYQGMMLATVVAVVVLAAAAHVLVAIAGPKDADRSDERDKEITRHGEYIGQFALAAGALVALALAMTEADHFWIANVILAGLVLAELTSVGTRIVLYRRGM
ncbi:MAG: hypothetical protein QNJ75_01270 [Acidimicrobiia bacterium]|nr:hypothetical protein [Acidimicrobiia bacterium]